MAVSSEGTAFKKLKNGWQPNYTAIDSIKKAVSDFMACQKPQDSLE